VRAYLRNRSAQLNFPDQLDGAAVAERPKGHKDDGVGLVAAVIRKKAAD